MKTILLHRGVGMLFGWRVLVCSPLIDDECWIIAAAADRAGEKLR